MMPLVPILGILGCLLLMFSLPSHNWYRLIVWMALGLIIYFVIRIVSPDTASRLRSKWSGSSF